MHCPQGPLFAGIEETLRSPSFPQSDIFATGNAQILCPEVILSKRSERRISSNRTTTIPMGNGPQPPPPPLFEEIFRSRAPSKCLFSGGVPPSARPRVILKALPRFAPGASVTK